MQKQSKIPPLPPLLPIKPPEDWTPDKGYSFSDTAPPPADYKPTEGTLKEAVRSSMPGSYPQQPEMPERPSVATRPEDRDFMMQKIKEMGNIPVPLPPDLKQAPKPEDYRKSPMEQVSGLAVFMAGIASAFTKKPIISFLTSTTQMMQAQQENNAELFKQKFEEWKANTDVALKTSEWQYKMYKEMTDMPKEQANIYARMMNDETARMALEAGMFNHMVPRVGAFNASMQQLNLKTQLAEANAQARAEKGEDYNAALLEEMNKLFMPSKKGGDSKEEARENLGKIDIMSLAPDEQIPGTPFTRAEAERWADEAFQQGDINKVVGRADSVKKDAVMKIIAQKYPNSSLATNAIKYAMRSQTEKAFVDSNKVAGRTMRAMNTAADHLATLQKTMDALKNKDMKALNAAFNYFGKQVGQSEVTNFEIAKQLVLDEVLRAAMGAAGAKYDREKLHNQISNAASPEQLEGAMDVLTDLVGGQFISLETQYKAGGGTRDFRNELMTEGARQAFTRAEKSKKEVNGQIHIDKPGFGKIQFDNIPMLDANTEGATGRTVTKKQYSASRDQTRIVYSDGSEEIVDGRQE